MTIINKRYKAVNFEFVETCGACPEQYDVLVNGKQVGYVRLRWGGLRCDYPDVGGETIYTASLNDYDLQGEFVSDMQRDFYLESIANALYNKIHESETVR